MGEGGYEMADVVQATAQNSPVLVADIGGTNARFALVDERDTALRPQHAKTYPVAQYPSLGDAAQAYLIEVLGNHRGHWPRRAALAVATAITGDAIRMTNSPWSFSVDALRQRLGLIELRMLNDFTALAWSVLTLTDADLRQVGAGEIIDRQAKGLIGPGTGLGVSGLIPTRDAGWTALQCEGGHSTFSPADPREAAILTAAWRRYPHVSFERLVCGTGLPLLLESVSSVDGLKPPDGATAEDLRSPAWITAQAQNGDALCQATMQTFCAMLGTAAGNLALMLGARGVFILAGASCPSWVRCSRRLYFESGSNRKGALPTTCVRCPRWSLTRRMATPRWWVPLMHCWLVSFVQALFTD